MEGGARLPVPLPLVRHSDVHSRVRVKRPYWGMRGRRSLNVYGPDLEPKARPLKKVRSDTSTP